jgi:hypothetical protein
MDENQSLNIMKDDLSQLPPDCSKFVTFGETMIRDTPADISDPSEHVWSTCLWLEASIRSPSHSVD